MAVLPQLVRMGKELSKCGMIALHVMARDVFLMNQMQDSSVSVTTIRCIAQNVEEIFGNPRDIPMLLADNAMAREDITLKDMNDEGYSLLFLLTSVAALKDSAETTIYQ